MKLDDIDKRILKILQEDATLPILEIGDRVGLSSNPCWRRIKRLEDHGVITRRVALVDPVALGLGVTVFVTIRTDRHDRAWFEGFSTAIGRISEIVECHRMSGDVDYFLKVLVHDIAHYDRVYQRLVDAVPGLSDVSSAFSMERLKADGGVDPWTI